MKTNNDTARSTKLDDARRHYGDEPHYFLVAFSLEEQPRLLNVSQVWQAAREGRRPTQFAATCLPSSERRLLKLLAELGGGAQ